MAKKQTFADKLKHTSQSNTCPVCGEAEVEVFCYQTEARCHNCGHTFPHTPPPGCGTYPFCKRGTPGAA